MPHTSRHSRAFLRLNLLALFLLLAAEGAHAKVGRVCSILGRASIWSINWTDQDGQDPCETAYQALWSCAAK